jgi:hypothetical protein
MSGSKNGYIMKGQFTPENSALVLVDYQVGTMQLIRTSSSDVPSLLNLNGAGSQFRLSKLLILTADLL